MKRRKKFEGAVGTWFIVMSQRILRRMSAERAERLGAKAFRFVSKFLKKRQLVVMENLRLAFPEWTEAERERVMWAHFEHFGMVAADFFRGYDRTREELDKMITFDGKEVFDEAFAKGQGVLVLTGHFGNWELIANWVSQSGYPLSVVIRDADTEDVNDVVNTMRRHPGTNLIARGDAAKEIIRRLRKNEAVAILPDQNSREVFIPFFGKPAGTVLGPGVIAERTKATVVFGYCVRVGVNRYHVHVEPALEPEPGYEVKGEGLMRTFHTVLEKAIRQYPEQYLWMHDRWRTARRKKML